MTRGWFITLEGCEGVGKTTQIGVVAETLRQMGKEVLTTREPGGTRLGEAVREILLHGADMDIHATSELLLMFAARSQHIEEVIRPALAAGITVVCDRFTDATYAYQGGGRGERRVRIATLEDMVQEGLQPDLTLLLDTEVEVGLARAGRRGDADRFESETVAFFQRVREAYLTHARHHADRTVIIDAGRDIGTVSTDIRRILQEWL